jgi:DNA-binding CsgD family transcriptional regulator
VARGSAAEEVARVLPELYALTPINEYPARALSLVRRVIGGNKGDFTEVDLESGCFRVLVDPEPPQLRDLSSARVAYMHEHPVLAHFVTGAPPDARLISDFVTRREFHRLGLYGEFFQHLGVENQLTVTVSTRSTGSLAGISIDRDRPDFDAYDRRVMDTLQPHLTMARDNAARFSEALAQRSRSEEPSDAALDRLTGRQLEILRQLSSGRTNAQIALELDISVGTVRKHLEHILRRLNVSTRTAAAVYYVRGAGVAETLPWTASIAAMLNDRDRPVPGVATR